MSGTSGESPGPTPAIDRWKPHLSPRGAGHAATSRRIGVWIELVGVTAVFIGLTLITPIYLNQKVATMPAHAYVLAADPRPGAVLNVPIDLYGAQGPGGECMLYQMVHDRPIVGGYLSRTPRSALWPFDRLFLNQLRVRIYNDQEPYVFTDEVMAHARENLRALDVRYVVLHARFLSEQDYQTVQATLKQVLGEPNYQDQEALLWYLE